jgi:membrane AbrB-like protein
MALRWLAVVVATVLVALGLSAIGFPSPTLFAALVVGLVYALSVARAPLAIPGPPTIAAQALIGVSLGASVDADTLRAVGHDWAPVLLVTVGTLGISLGAGVVMSRVTGLDRATACLGLIAGGASGIVAMADELGADGRLVAFMQYLRVLVVVITAPLLAHLLVSGGGGGGDVTPSGAGLGADLAFTVVCAVGGVALGRLLRFTASALLLPLVLAAAASLGGNTTCVVAVQALRVFAMVLAAPPLVRLLVRSGSR